MAESRERATAASWKIKKMPKKISTLRLDRRFTRDEFDRMSFGFIPQEMEDKCFIYMDEHNLCFHRSWTGYFIYRVSLIPDQGGFRVGEVEVNRSQNQYSEDHDDYDLQVVTWLIDNLLLGKDTEIPEASTPPLNYEIIDD